MTDSRSQKNQKIYHKWWVWIVIILIIAIGVYFIFGNDIKAYKMGIDVRYLDNPRYCQNHSDCTFAYDNCNAINTFNYKEGRGGQCLRETCGTLCRENECILKECE